MKKIFLSFIILFSVSQNIFCKEVSNDVILQKIENIIEMQKMMYETTNKRFELVDKRFDLLYAEMNNRFEQVNKQINIIMWMIGILSGVSIAITSYLFKSLQTEIRKITILETEIKETIKSSELENIKNTIKGIIKLLEKEGKLIPL